MSDTQVPETAGAGTPGPGPGTVPPNPASGTPQGGGVEREFTIRAMTQRQLVTRRFLRHRGAMLGFAVFLFVLVLSNSAICFFGMKFGQAATCSLVKKFGSANRIAARQVSSTDAVLAGEKLSMGLSGETVSRRGKQWLDASIAMRAGTASPYGRRWYLRCLSIDGGAGQPAAGRSSTK